jgi:serine/threonine protein kinase
LITVFISCFKLDHTVYKTFFQYGFSADVYSLSIIIFELFSGIDPFPGHFAQVFEAKRLDEKPVIPSNFPSDLKELICRGWTKEPKDRPPIEEFKSAFNKMLPKAEKNYSLTLPEDNSSNENKEQLPIPHQEVDLAEKTEDELCTNTKAGELFEVWSIGYFQSSFYV